MAEGGERGMVGKKSDRENQQLFWLASCHGNRPTTSLEILIGSVQPLASTERKDHARHRPLVGLLEQNIISLNVVFEMN